MFEASGCERPGSASPFDTAFPPESGRSRLVARALREWGLDELDAALQAGERPPREAWLRLAEAPLGLVGKLVEHRRGAWDAARCRVERRCFLPLEAWTTGESAASLPTDVVAGDDLASLARAAGAGCRVVVVEPLRDGDLGRRVDRLLAACDLLAPAAGWAGWMPRPAVPLDVSGADDASPAGIDALRAVALASLALPLEVDIVVPADMFGVKTAVVALRFGANCLLGSDACVDEVLKLDQPTPVD